MSLSIEDVIGSIDMNKIPIVVLDQRWHLLFPEKDKTPEIRKLEKELNETMQLQGKITTDLKALRKIKVQLMQDVMNTAESTELTEAKRLKKQEHNHKLILDAKEKIQKLEEEELLIPQKIKDANLALVIESVNVCYKRINKNRKDIEVLGKWIEEVRVELKKRVLIKQDKEIKNTEIYTYMHDLLGPKVMEVFDEKSN